MRVLESEESISSFNGKVISSIQHQSWCEVGSLNYDKIVITFSDKTHWYLTSWDVEQYTSGISFSDDE